MTNTNRAGLDPQGSYFAKPDEDPAGTGSLVLVERVLEALMQHASMPRKPAASLLIERMRAMPALRLFLVRDASEYAEPIGDEFAWCAEREAATVRVQDPRNPHDWTGRLVSLPARQGITGGTGALELLARLWGVGASVSLSTLSERARARVWWRIARLAVLQADCASLIATDTAPVALASLSDVQEVRAVGPIGSGSLRIEPEGGSWPHIKGKPWTEAERRALFLMRHLHKMTGEQLAEIAEVTRQAIDEVIGPERPPGGLASIKAKSRAWQPSADLLAACGQPLQPLQSMAGAIERMRTTA